jgi:hypothetical protein
MWNYVTDLIKQDKKGYTIKYVQYNVMANLVLLYRCDN